VCLSVCKVEVGLAQKWYWISWMAILR